MYGADAVKKRRRKKRLINVIKLDPSSTASVGKRYDDVMPIYDFMFFFSEVVLMMSASRQKFISRARGKVLEIAVGTGRNIRYYNRPMDLTLADISPRMLKRTRQKANLRGLDAKYVQLDGESLPFPDNCFDTVLLSLCITSFPDPVAALREMARVCQPSGRLLLLENGRSSNEWVGKFQDWRAPTHVRIIGTRWNRDPVQICLEAGLSITYFERKFLGILHLLELSPERASWPAEALPA